MLRTGQRFFDMPSGPGRAMSAFSQGFVLAGQGKRAGSRPKMALSVINAKGSGVILRSWQCTGTGASSRRAGFYTPTRERYESHPKAHGAIPGATV